MGKRKRNQSNVVLSTFHVKILQHHIINSEKYDALRLLQSAQDKTLIEPTGIEKLTRLLECNCFKDVIVLMKQNPRINVAQMKKHPLLYCEHKDANSYIVELMQLFFMRGMTIDRFVESDVSLLEWIADQSFIFNLNVACTLFDTAVRFGCDLNMQSGDFRSLVERIISGDHLYELVEHIVKKHQVRLDESLWHMVLWSYFNELKFKKIRQLLSDNHVDMPPVCIPRASDIHTFVSSISYLAERSDDYWIDITSSKYKHRAEEIPVTLVEYCRLVLNEYHYSKNEYYLIIDFCTLIQTNMKKHERNIKLILNPIMPDVSAQLLFQYFSH